MQNRDILLNKIEETGAKFLDLRWTDICGKEQHLSLNTQFLPHFLFEKGYLIDLDDKEKQALKLDFASIVLDPFFNDATLQVRCSIKDYPYDVRTIAERAAAYLKATNIANLCNISSRVEFFLFDEIRWSSSVNEVFYKINAEGASFNNDKEIAGGNTGHRPDFRAANFSTPPLDYSQDIRSAISLTLESLNIKITAHNHARASANQCKLTTDFSALVEKADLTQLLKYVVRNTAHNFAKTATFMPKPLADEHGSGMSCCIFLAQDEQNLFAWHQEHSLSELGIYFLGGIIKHIKALNAFTNPTTLSYKRLLTEGKVINICNCNNNPHINLCFPDPAANPYLAYSALLMAGIDGIKNKINPPIVSKTIEIRTSENLGQALQSLETDQEFLLNDNVFTKEFITKYIEIKNKEWRLVNSLVHPMEFKLYYSL